MLSDRGRLAQGERRRGDRRRAHPRNTRTRCGCWRALRDRRGATLGFGHCAARLEAQLRRPRRIRGICAIDAGTLPPDDGFARAAFARHQRRSEEHTSELQSHHDLVCRLLLEKKKKKIKNTQFEKKKKKNKKL